MVVEAEVVAATQSPRANLFPVSLLQLAQRIVVLAAIPTGCGFSSWLATVPSCIINALTELTKLFPC